ncbi:MAG TPA: FAD-dependent 5-carboxymethylaminomethyl-2-thiouridine(34) oxidoreductase MnmC, partial [Caldimonas sp.]|nr:FAD-dependent 5-carboxymethylaminomethyl-2-thiouridine(34) oxidoreductase MnmC [Caldimonas sp.]
LAAVPRDPIVMPLAQQLVDDWPPHTFNLHRLPFEDGRVELLLAFGDARDWLPQIDAAVDAFFLDGFAPAKNPQLWEPRLFKSMGRIAVPEATAATWSAAKPVRDGLRAAGFDARRADGRDGKRDITVARYAPAFATRLRDRRRPATPSRSGDPVLVVGAGLAGCATACALAEHGLASIVIDRTEAIASEGSANPGGLFHGVVHRDDARHARWHRAAAFEARRQVADAIASHGVAGGLDGLLRLEIPVQAGHFDACVARMKDTVLRLGFPASYVAPLTPSQASAHGGVPVAVPAWFFPGGGWVDPRGLARAYIDRAGSSVELRLDTTVAALRIDDDGRWLLLDPAGRTIASSPHVVLANGGGALELLGANDCTGLIEKRRGQLSAAPTSALPLQARVRLPIAGAGYVLPPIDGRVWFGATSDLEDGDAPRENDHRRNVERLRHLLPYAPLLSPDKLDDRVAFRYSTRDRLPLIGAVPAAWLGPALREKRAIADSRHPEQVRSAARAPGLFMLSALGSRGIAGSALGARLVAAAIGGAPMTIEADLLDAIDPARFACRAWRRGRGGVASLDQPAGPTAGGSAGS